jgi:ribonuclease E
MQAEEAREAEEAEDDPIPESPMDRAAEDDIGSRHEDEAEGNGDPAAPVGQDAAEPEPARIIDVVVDAAIAAAVEQPAGAEPASEPPAALPSATAAESEAGAATAEAGSPMATPPADSAQPQAPAADADAAAAPPPHDVAADAHADAHADAPGDAPAEAPWGPLGGAADAGSDAAALEAAPAEALEGDGAVAVPGQGEPRQSRRRDRHGRGRREDRSRDDRSREDRPQADRAEAREDRGDDESGLREDAEEEAPPELLGGEGPEESDNGREERRIPPRFLRHYKIQEVIKRRQIMLVQVVKEERGTKGAALTTYISLAGRFSVLMPNSPRGGGVSRKITSAADRKRLREVIDELGLPDGMSLIVRTAGAQRPKPEIKRDCEYLLRLWDNIRERTLASTAPALIYEEADLIKRAIRDVFSRDVEEIVVEGEDAYQDARDFMRMLMPQHVKKIQYAREGGLFARHQVEAQLDAMHSPTVQLKSGGYIVINQTEALVAIDVNSGRATRERHIEDTALRTNLEASDEIARQLRLRDLAGLIVIDFIDMESSKHDGMVERRLKDALRHDRARIQVGRISHFGLLEMSRQRLRPSLAETSFVTCPHCQGRGTVRSIESSALSVLRAIEEEGAKRRSAEIAVHCCSVVALYLLNRKRDRLTQLEEHFGMAVLFEPDETLSGPQHRIERLRAAEPSSQRALPPPSQAALRMDYAPEPEPEEDEAEEEVEAGTEAGAEEENEPAVAREGETQAEAEARVAAEGGKRRRRRRRRRGGKPEGAPGSEAAAGADSTEEGEEETGEEDAAEEDAPEAVAEVVEAPLAAAEEGEAPAASEAAGEARGSGPRRRRGRRGSGPRAEGVPGAEASRPVPVNPAPPPRYTGPTPADPFAGHVDDILAAMEAAEAAAEAAAASRQGRIAMGAPAEPQPVPTAEPQPAAPAEPETVAPAEPDMVAAVEPEMVAPAEPETLAAAEPQPVSTPEPQAAATTEPPPVSATIPEIEPIEAAPVATAQPVTPEAPAPVAPAPAMAEPGTVEPSAAPAALAEPVATSPVPGDAAPAPAPAPASEPVAAAAEPVQGPVVQPKVLGEAEIAAPRRAGWWRR